MLVVREPVDVRYLAGYEEGRIVRDARYSHEELRILVRFNNPSDLLVQLVYLPVQELDGLQVIVHRIYGERPEVDLAVFCERISLILQPSRREIRMDLVLLHGPELDHVVPPPHQVPDLPDVPPGHVRFGYHVGPQQVPAPWRPPCLSSPLRTRLPSPSAGAPRSHRSLAP